MVDPGGSGRAEFYAEYFNELHRSCNGPISAFIREYRPSRVFANSNSVLVANAYQSLCRRSPPKGAIGLLLQKRKARGPADVAAEAGLN